MIKKKDKVIRVFKAFVTSLLFFGFLFIVHVNKVDAQQQTVLVAGGDVNWCLTTVQPDIYYNNQKPGRKAWMGLPFLNTPKDRKYLQRKYGRVVDNPQAHFNIALHYHLSFNSDKEKERYPFLKIAPVLRKADISFVNLESPLSDNGRWQGAFRTPESFAAAMKWAGIDVVSIANNHALDVGGEGLMNTIESLKRNGIGEVGGGEDLKNATKPFIIERNGIKFAFLAYTQFVNEGPSSFALPKRSSQERSSRKYSLRPSRTGVAPADPLLIKKDIEAIREKVDYIIVSFHGGVENRQQTAPSERKFFKQIIDDGADIVFGSHPHVPEGIEVYKGHPLIYNTGNFIFGHNHAYWMDNYLTRFIFKNKRLKRVEVLPIAGRGQDMSQPFLLKDIRATKLLKEVKGLSENLLGTTMKIKNNIGIIKL